MLSAFSRLQFTPDSQRLLPSLLDRSMVKWRILWWNLLQCWSICRTANHLAQLGARKRLHIGLLRAAVFSGAGLHCRHEQPGVAALFCTTNERFIRLCEP